MYALKISNLRKSFKSINKIVKAVDGISFQVKKGEIFGLLGVNGAGKSTTLNMLCGLILSDSGKIEMFGKDFFKHEEELRGQFNLATAYYSLSGNLTVRQNLKVYARLYNVKNPEKKIKELTEKFLFTKHFDTRVRSLSSGEKTKLVLIKSLLNDPKLLFLDECTAGLDPDVAEIVRDHIMEYNKETGCTIIFTSHYMQEVEQMCNRIAFMDKGKIVKIGKAKDLINELETQRIQIHFSKKIEKAKQILRNENIKFEVPDKGVLSFQIKNREKIVYPILEKFVKAQIPFDDLHLNKPTLEEYFIKQSRKND
jgi:ABC-2 type transport system ATP-binding protein